MIDLLRWKKALVPDTAVPSLKGTRVRPFDGIREKKMSLGHAPKEVNSIVCLSATGMRP